MQYYLARISAGLAEHLGNDMHMQFLQLYQEMLAGLQFEVSWWPGHMAALDGSNRHVKQLQFTSNPKEHIDKT